METFQVLRKMLIFRFCQLDSGGTAVLALAIVLPAILLLFLRKGERSRTSEDEDGFPRGPWRLPIVGNLPLFLSLPHQSLAKLYFEQGHGAIIGLHLGVQRAVVVSSAALARELLLTHDKAFANRVHFSFADHLFYGYGRAVILSAHTPRFIHLRKVYMLELLTARRLHDMREARYIEGRRLLHHLRDYSGTAVELGAVIAEMNANAMGRLMQSKTLDEVAPELPELIRAMQNLTIPTVGDFVPAFSLLDIITKIRMKKLHQRIDLAFDSILQERSRLMETVPPEQLPNDFLQCLLSRKQDNDDEESISPVEIKAIMLDLFLAGIDTSTSTVEWAMAELLRNQECFEKLRKEVDEVKKGELRYITDEDVQKMPYLYSVVKEVLRLHPVVPLLLPRISSEECKIEDYILPKETMAFVNVWAIGRDPKIWDRPEDFYPERFEMRETDMKGQDYELLPFGSGRRMCVGIRLGISMVSVTLANLIRFFDWELPPNQSASSINMSEQNGLGSGMACPIKAVPYVRSGFLGSSFL